MRLGKRLKWFACGLIGLSAAFAFQRPFRQFDGVEYSIGDVPLPADYREKTEWAFARLMYPPGPLNGYRYRDLDWHVGVSLWTQDFPRADRHFSLAVRRLTRIHVRSVEQPVNLDEGDAYDWPWLYAVQVGEWGLTDVQGQELREYLLRGGFFWGDDFHGNAEWAEFESRIRKALPDSPSVRLPATIPFFTPSTISPRESRCPARPTCAPDTNPTTARPAAAPTGAPSMTARAASWWRSRITPISATPGSGPTTPIIPPDSPTSPSVSVSITSSTP